MKKLWVVTLLFPFIISAHPGIGIVKDSKGNIYYTDLEQVWKISNGKPSVILPHVHTHELYIDKNDNLYGEHIRYTGETSNKYYHHLWVLKPDGDLDTLIGPLQAYVGTDYSLARDIKGNEYYIKLTDSSRIFKKSAGSKEVVFAKGNFAGVTWLHPQKNSSVLYVHRNTVYRIDSNGRSTILANNIAGKNPTFKFSAQNRLVWGVWQDGTENVYVAVFSDQAVKKINPAGAVTIVYQSAGKWTPLHGVFDNSNRLWVLEASDKNEVRTVLVTSSGTASKKEKQLRLSPILLSGVAVCVMASACLFFRMQGRKK